MVLHIHFKKEGLKWAYFGSKVGSKTFPTFGIK
jgi:hypothetical protein